MEMRVDLSTWHDNPCVNPCSSSLLPPSCSTLSLEFNHRPQKTERTQSEVKKLQLNPRLIETSIHFFSSLTSFPSNSVLFLTDLQFFSCLPSFRIPYSPISFLFLPIPTFSSLFLPPYFSATIVPFLHSVLDSLCPFLHIFLTFLPLCIHAFFIPPSYIPTLFLTPSSPSIPL